LHCTPFLTGVPAPSKHRSGALSLAKSLKAPHGLPPPTDARITDPIRFPVLIGDIGGTNARFGLLPEPDSPAEMFEPVATADFPDLEARGRSGGLRPHQHQAALGADRRGGSDHRRRVALTNAHWVLKPREIMAKTGVRDVILLNDFEALALALTALEGATWSSSAAILPRLSAQKWCSGRARGWALAL
jgi:glucokinase